MRCCLQYKNAHLLVKTVLEVPQATMRKLLRALRWPTVMAALIFTAITFCNIAVLSAGNINEEPSKCDAIVVLGTLVHEDGSLSIMLQDRVDKGIELYNVCASFDIETYSFYEFNRPLEGFDDFSDGIAITEEEYNEIYSSHIYLGGFEWNNL